MATRRKGTKTAAKSARHTATKSATPPSVDKPVVAGPPIIQVGLVPTPTPPPAAEDIPVNTARWKREWDSKSRKRFTRIVMLKAAGRKTAQIAKALNTTEDTIRHYLWLGGKNGWYDRASGELTDPHEELVYNTAHKIVRNVNAALDGVVLMPGQQEMTIEAAKGTGLFKTHQVVKGNTEHNTVVALKIEMPALSAQNQLVEIREDQMGGVPAYSEGEVDTP